MALSKYRRALERSLKTEEERQVIREFYDMSYADFLRYYSASIDDLVTGIDRTRLAGRPYQKENILYRAQKLKSGDPVSGFITQLPAGAGKTELFFQTLLKTAKEVTVGDEVKLITPPTVILVPSEDLLNQVCDELHRRFPNLLVGKKYGGETDIQPLTVCIYNTFMEDVQSGFIQPSDVKLAVLDEAHRGLSDSRFKEFNRLKGLTLMDAYSASPAFHANKNLYELLGKESVIPNPSDRELTDMGHLAKCHNVILTIKLKKEDVPPEIANDSQKYGDFLQRLKIQAALEFYKTYEDAETGQRAFGKPVVGFTRYVRDAQVAEGVFQEELADMAANDKVAAKILKPYTHYTQTLSRSLGNDAVDAAFDKILPLDRVKPERKKNPPERALMTFTSKMAREGTDVPDWKVALGIHTGPIVDEIQTRGRVRRRKGDELSIVLDCIVEEDGKILGNPVPYYKAIDDPTIIRGVQTVTAGPELIGLAAADLMEFKNQDEMRTLVLGGGTAEEEKSEDFDRLWKRIQTHIHKQSKKPVPEPYMLDGDPVKHKIFAVNGVDGDGGTKKTELRISKTGIDQFRRELGIPGQLNSLWLAEEALEQVVIGSGHRAGHYRDAFRKMATLALAHFASDNSNPYMLHGRPILMQSRLDEDGSLVSAFHHSAVRTFKEALDVLPGKTRRYLNQDEFAAAVLDQVEQPNKYRSQIAALWKEARAHYDQHHRPGQRTNFDIGGHRVEVAKCLDEEGQAIFCIERKGVRAARRHFGIPNITFDIDGIEWTTEQSEVIRITKQMEEGQYPNIEGTGMLVYHGMAEAAGLNKAGLQPVYEALEAEWKKRSPVFDYEQRHYTPTAGGNDPLRVTIEEKTYEIPVEQCGIFRSGTGSAFCVHSSQSNKFKTAPEITKGMLGVVKMAKEAPNNTSTISVIYQALEIEWKKRRPVFDYDRQHYVATTDGNEPLKVTVEEKTYEVPVEQCGIFRSGVQYPFCVHESQSTKFKVAPEITKGMLAFKKMADKVSLSESKVSPIYDALEAEWKKRRPIFDYEKGYYVATVGGNDPLRVTVEEKTYEIPIEQCGIFRSGNNYPFCVHESQSRKFEIAPDITKGMLSGQKMADKASTDAPNLYLVYEALEVEWKKRKPVFDYEKQHYISTVGGIDPLKVVVGERTYEIPVEMCGIYKNRSRYAFFVHDSQSYKFETAPEITPGMLGINEDMRQLVGTSAKNLSAAYQLIRNEWDSRKPIFDYQKKHYVPTAGNAVLQIHVGEKTFEVPTEKCGVFRSKAVFPFCVHTSLSGTLRKIVDATQEMQKIAGSGTPDDDNESLRKPRPNAPRRSPARMNEAERAEQKRGGNRME